MKKNKKFQQGAVAWALYDWANSAFALTVMAGFFPIFFKDYWSKDVEATVSTFWLGVSNTTAGVIIAVSAPFLGSLADRSSSRKKFLVTFAMLGAFSTALFSLIPAGAWPFAAFGYVVSYATWLASIIFYDSLIVTVSSSEDVDRVSGLGFSMGYIGSALLFSVNVAMTLKPEFFGLSGAAAAVKISFLCVSVWWILFTLPLIFRLKEPEGEKTKFIIIAKEGFQRVFQTFREIRAHKIAFLFLLSYWFYIDGVDTIVVMAVDYGISIGLESSDLIAALLLVQYVAFPFAYLFGWMGQKFGPKKFIFIGIGVYFIITLLATFSLDSGTYNFFGFHINKFFVIAFLIGTVQGGVQALSRSYFSRLIPEERSAEFFGFYNMVGKFAVILGPVLIGTVGRITGNPRAGMLSIIVLFFIGGFFLIRVHLLEKKI